MAKKLSFYVIATLLDLAIKGVKGAIRAVDVIRDLCDNGKIDDSVDSPKFVSDLVPILDQLDAVLDALKYSPAAAGSLAIDVFDESNGHA